MKTNNAGLQDLQNAVANYMMMPFNAENGPLMTIRQLNPGKVTYKLYDSKCLYFAFLLFSPLLVQEYRL